MTSDLVCIDTQILIWGVRRPSEPPVTPGQEDMVPKAEAFIQWLAENKKHVMLPAVVLGEFLIPVPTDQHSEVIATLSKGFQIRPYDALAAAKYAELWTWRSQDATHDTLKQQGLTGAHIKADSVNHGFRIIRAVHTATDSFLYLTRTLLQPIKPAPTVNP